MVSIGDDGEEEDTQSSVRLTVSLSSISIPSTSQPASFLGFFGVGSLGCTWACLETKTLCLAGRKFAAFTDVTSSMAGQEQGP